MAEVCVACFRAFFFPTYVQHQPATKSGWTRLTGYSLFRPSLGCRISCGVGGGAFHLITTLSLYCYVIYWAMNKEGVYSHVFGTKKGSTFFARIFRVGARRCTQAKQLEHTFRRPSPTHKVSRQHARPLVYYFTRGIRLKYYADKESPWEYPFLDKNREGTPYSTLKICISTFFITRESFNDQVLTGTSL